MNKYCLDANILIQAWQKYYNPRFCPDYWEILIKLGEQERIFIPKSVYEEIIRIEDDLSKWLKTSKIPIREENESIINCWKQILTNNPVHQRLVDNIKGRSLADPWVIAHALYESATVVTKEEKVTALNSPKIKIPNVCDNIGVRWINDFQFVDEVGIRFSCYLS